MRARLQSVLLTAGMVVTTLNIVVAAPLLGLWAGSRLTGDTQISMVAVATVAVVALAVALALVRLLAWLGERHDALHGRPRVVRRHVSWMRSMSGERPHTPNSGVAPLGALDYVLVSAVVIVLIAFEIWFAFYSGSPFDQRSGRG